MERVQSLINKLASQANAQASAADLLLTTELLYAELRRFSEKENMPVQNGISVWLPLGYSQKSNVPIVAPEPTNASLAGENNPVTEESKEQIPSIAGPAIQNEQSKERAATPQPPPMPVPPAQVKLVEVEPLASPVTPSKEIAGEEGDLLYTLHMARQEANKVAEDLKQKSETSAPIASSESLKSEISQTRPFPQYPDAATLMKNIFPVAPDPAPVSREVNQLVIDPAIPLNEKLMEKKVELADVLATGPKITDLRKAITINDKYQMINVLFRGDENMFERSIRTLNNFGSLPEARFWMQRELVVKLGWDEKEETVQRFQALVNRRFA